MPRCKKDSLNSGGMTQDGRYPAICDLSGFRGWNTDFVLDPYGRRVLKQFADEEHPLEHPTPIRGEKALPWSRPYNDRTVVLGEVTEDDF